MTRILFALSLFLIATAAYAESSRAGDDAQINCPKPGGRSVAAIVAPASPAIPAPAQNLLATGGHGASSTHPHNAAAPRIISPRWHSFLPGMFR